MSTLEKAYRAEMFCLFDFYYANCSQIRTYSVQQLIVMNLYHFTHTYIHTYILRYYVCRYVCRYMHSIKGLSLLIVTSLVPETMLSICTQDILWEWLAVNGFMQQCRVWCRCVAMYVCGGNRRYWTISSVL